MREKKTHLYFDSEERKLLLHSLVELKNQLIKQGRYTDPVDELIFKVINAPVKRMKMVGGIEIEVQRIDNFKMPNAVAHEITQEELQKELLKAANAKGSYECIVDEIYSLREVKQNAQVAGTEREGIKRRIREMQQ